MLTIFSLSTITQEKSPLLLSASVGNGSGHRHLSTTPEKPNRPSGGSRIRSKQLSHSSLKPTGFFAELTFSYLSWLRCSICLTKAQDSEETYETDDLQVFCPIRKLDATSVTCSTPNSRYFPCAAGMEEKYVWILSSSPSSVRYVAE